MTQHNKLPDNDPVKTWVAYLRQQGKSHHTVSAYQRGIEQFIRWHEAAYQTDFDVSVVMPRDIRDWKANQQSIEKVAPRTINQRLVAVNRFFHWASEQKLCLDNPADDIANVRLPIREPQGLTSDDLRRLLRAARLDRRDYAIIELMAGTGIRVGELLSLQIGDIEIGERSGKVIIRQGKQENYREIPLTTDVRKALKDYLATEHPDKENPNCPLWIGGKGWVSHRSTIMRMLEKYSKAANIPPVNPHALRHTFATRYLEANPDDLRGLARLLGHSNLNAVMIYTEPNMDSLSARMERIDSNL